MTDNLNNVITEQELQDLLKAYAQSFGVPSSREELLAIASSILTFQQKQGIAKLSPDCIESLLPRVVDEFNPEALANYVIDSSTTNLVQSVNQWQQTLKNQVLKTLNAYINKFQPDQNLDLSKTVLSIIPLVENTQLLHAEANSLIQKVTAQFNWKNALTQVVDPNALAIADQLSKLLQFGNVEELVKSALVGDRQLLNQPLDRITESLVNDKLAEILGSNAIHLDVDTRQMMIKQVTFKLNIMQSSPPPTKSNAEIEMQVDDESGRFLASRKEHLEMENLFHRDEGRS